MFSGFWLNAEVRPGIHSGAGLALAAIDRMKLLVLVLAGALLGIVVASVVVPPALAWYTAPGGLPEGAQVQALVQIPEVIRYSTGRLIRGQLIGAAIGALVGLGLGIFVNARAKSSPRLVQG